MSERKQLKKENLEIGSKKWILISLGTRERVRRK